MASYRSTIKQWSLHNKTVLVRADLNVPFGTTGFDDYKLQAIRPTLDLIIKSGGRIILTTHLGRPKDRSPRLSTEQLISWFTTNGYRISFQAYNNFVEDPQSDITLLENLRFYPEEKKNDPAFAKKLAALADFYVNDAFGLCHRKDTSIFDVPILFKREQRSIGLLIERELTELSRLLYDYEQPFVLVCGGEKVHDKLPLLKNLIDRVQTVLMCPALTFTFLKAHGKEVGRSLVDPSAYSAAKAFLKKAETKGVKILFPLDYQVAQETITGALSTTATDEIAPNEVGISIGPKTATLFTAELKKAKTIFFNGTPGMLNRPETLHGTQAILKAIGTSSAWSVIGGGATVSAARHFKLDSAIDFCSTGGGATLVYLSGQELPGLRAFKDT